MADDHPSAVVTEPGDEFTSHTPPAPPRKARAQGRRNFLIVAIVVVLVIAGYFFWRHLSSYESTDDAQVDVHLYPVSARISGYVTKVNVADNQFVQQGTVLVEIDPSDYEVAIDQAKAALASSEATARSLNLTVPVATVNASTQLQSASSSVEEENAAIAADEKDLAAARDQLTAAEANDVKAQNDVRRYKELADKQEVSAQTYDQAQATGKASTASVAAARDNVASSEQAVQRERSKLAQSEASRTYAQTGPQQVSSTEARARAAIADVQQRRAALQQAELNLQYTKIVAPVSGEVNKTVVVGLNVQPGQQLLTVVPLEEVWITANFKETQLKKMRVGQAAEVYVDSNGRKYRGRVDSIAGATGPLFSLLPPENATGNYVKIVQRIPVKIVLDSGQNNDHQLRPGMNVEPDVYLQ
jgi:membrane fusion protein (multidrug efflux system)